MILCKLSTWSVMCGIYRPLRPNPSVPPKPYMSLSQQHQRSSYLSSYRSIVLSLSHQTFVTCDANYFHPFFAILHLLHQLIQTLPHDLLDCLNPLSLQSASLSSTFHYPKLYHLFHAVCQFSHYMLKVLELWLQDS